MTLTASMASTVKLWEEGSYAQRPDPGYRPGVEITCTDGSWGFYMRRRTVSGHSDSRETAKASIHGILTQLRVLPASSCPS